MASILIIDDSLLARHSHSTTLHELGHETTEACNGLEGLKLLGQQSFDAALVDLMMPEMDGIAFLEAIKERAINLPVVILSADIQESKQQQCFDLGAIAFLEKPAKKQKLINLLEKTLNL